ncbi:MAG TPA: type I DNA topoisomerase [Candidatus Paceibacterota bacterium]|nr:type I DNA topoisomerase [Candidatus Paceibacterota bacterium]
MELIIVESPTKAKTIGKFVGKEFVVESSYGHIRDLPKSKIGIDIAHDFAPSYMIPKKAEPVVAHLKSLAKKADKVILATDEDREGEAIAWHLVSALDLDGTKTAKGAVTGAKPYERIAFHEITKNAIMEALEHPHTLDVNLVDAQQARRVLDRLVGYELSPFLWRKIRYGLSAGRVQSVAVRLVVERERLIRAFNKEEYWTIEAAFLPPKGKSAFPAVLNSVNGKAVGKMGIKSAADARSIIEGLKGAEYRIADIAVKEVRRNPSPPFTTSTLQQEAARKLGFSAKQTMVIAQHLYENGHITYMRTDSLNLAASALAQAQHVIGEEFGKQYQLPSPRYYANRSKGAQEAHEAIRPTNLAAVSGSQIGLKDRGELRLYDLIWKRTIASQMKEATLEQTAVDIAADTSHGEIFRANGQTIIFDGFIRVYTEGKDDDANGEIEGGLPKLENGMALTLAAGGAAEGSKENPAGVQHFTEPPARYTDATLVKALEAEGVGRPSTYAPTLSTIQERGYVEKEDKKYKPTEIGTLVNDLLVENFPEIVDVKFTSHIEEELDEIAEGQMKWTDVCREFYGPFKKNLAEKEASVEKQVEISTTPCPHCGKPMIIKFGRMGKFLACPEPGVKVTLPMPEEAAQIKALEEKTKDERCPICGKPMKVTRGRFGFFLGCTDYPKCKGISKIWNKTGFKCPNCLESPERREKPGDIVEKKSRGRGKPFFACTRYPDCTFVMNKKPESDEELQAAFKNWKENPPKPKRARAKK